MSRTLTFLYILDMFALAFFTAGNCRIGETISSVAWSLEASGKHLGKVLRPVIDWLFSWIEENHCYGAYQTYLRITGTKPIGSTNV